ncbi:MAG TPA: hypothetical protein VG435_03730 [Acidimicrobiales bacterium]|jgi:hypothetical protein|nr:hypothetical protein [Acidimicrobiales bacterium]
MRPEIVVGRLVTAGLLGWMAWIHLHLWDGGYRHIHDIGPLFLANFVLAVLAGLVVVAAPARLLPFAAVGAALLAGGTLVGLAISINHGLFGFRDSTNAPFADLSIWVEALAVVAGVVLAIRSWVRRPPRSSSGRLSGPARTATSAG